MTYVILDLDKPRKFRLDLNAICEIEDMFNLPFQEIFVEERIGVRHLRAILWVGLKSFDKRISRSEVGDLLQEHLQIGAVDDIIRAVKKALALSGLSDNKEAASDGDGSGN